MSTAKKKTAKKKTPKKIVLKHSQNDSSVKAFIASIDDEVLRKECETLLKLFEETTGLAAKMWGPSMIGFGEYTYYRSNGAEGSYMATGFSPRKSGPTIYIMPGYADYSEIIEKLGKVKLGKSCVYIKRLEDINLKTLKVLIKRGLKDLKKTHGTNY